MALPRAERLAEKYYCERLSAGESVDFTKALGRPANLLSILAEENATIVLNKTGSEIVMKRDEAIVMINVMEVENLDVISGSVRVFATNVPRWMPALFWTRSVTVLGVADAVKDALTDYGAAKDATVQNITKLQFDTDNDLYVVGRGKEGTPIDYTTTDDWADAATLNVLDFDEVTILIKNTGSNPADIAVYVKANAAGSIEYEEVSPTTLNAGDVYKVQLSGRYSRVIIRAKNNISGSSTTLRIEWVGGK